MSIFFIGYKCGMTSFFSSEGLVYPVTAVKLYLNYILDIKAFNDVFYLVKIGACSLDKRKSNKPLIGFYNKVGLDCLKYMLTFKIARDKLADFKTGDIIPLSFLNILDKVDIVASSKGRGFSGVIKRHNFKSQGASHGNSLSHRVPGSIGQCQTPGRVFKGKKMPGRFGNTRITSKNLSILEVFEDLNVVLLKGSIPGFNGNKIFLRKKV